MYFQRPPEKRALADIPEHVLESYLSFYVMSLKKKGNDYLLYAFKTNMSALINSLKAKGIDTKTMKHFTDVLASKRKELTGKGLGGSTNRAALITWEMEERF